MSRPRRADRFHRASRDFKGIDVAAVRYIDDETRQALLCSIRGISQALGSVFKPLTYRDDLYVKVIGTSSLKSHVGITSRRQIMLDAAKLQSAEEAITQSGVEPTISLNIDWNKPLTVDKETDRLVMNLCDTDRAYSLDRARAFAAIQHHTKRRDTRSATPITDQHLPTVALGRINRYMLGAQQYEFERDPGQFIADAMYENRSLTDAIAGVQVPPIVPSTVSFGGLRVVALRKKPEQFHQSDYAEWHEGCEFNELKLVRRTDDDDRFPLAGDNEDLIFE